MVSNGFQWFPMVSNGSQWFPMVPNGSQWFSMVSNGFQWFPMVSNGFQWFQWFPMVSNGSNGFQWFPMVSIGSNGSNGLQPFSSRVKTHVNLIMLVLKLDFPTVVRLHGALLPKLSSITSPRCFFEASTFYV